MPASSANSALPAARLAALRRSGGGPDWVTKTDVTDYLRCPYAYSLLWRDEISRDDMFDDRVAEMLAAGDRFHLEVDEQLVADGAAVLAASTSQQAEALATELTVQRPPMLYNHDRHLHGRPDAIHPRAGVWWPVETKSHGRPRPSDRIELAFYWLLLEPANTDIDAAPHGILNLLRDGEMVSVEIVLSPGDLAAAERLIDEVRAARHSPVPPRPCGCPVCTGPRREEVDRYVREHRSVGLLHGVGPKLEKAFASCGITDYDQLLDYNVEELVTMLRNAGARRASYDAVEGWQWHAHAYNTARPTIYFSNPDVVPPYIALDLEYDSNHDCRIWLASLCVVNSAAEQQLHQVWADPAPAAEAELLAELVELLEHYPDLPVVTWGGTWADIPTLNKAAARHGIDPLRGRRHEDLGLWARDNLRIPSDSLSIKAVAAAFGLTRQSELSSGLEALSLYWAYATAQAPEQQELKAALLRYGADDVLTLVELAATLRDYDVPDFDTVEVIDLARLFSPGP